MHARWMVLLALSGCMEPQGGPEGGDPDVDAGDGVQPPSQQALPLSAPDPANNPRTPAKVALGRLLFWDPVLSGDGDVACATCHDPEVGYADPRPSSTTVGGRNAMTVLNAAWNGAVVGRTLPDSEQAPMFWDNRARSLEQQARGPITAADEMMGDHYTEATIFPELIARLQGIPDYVARFEAVYGPGSITETNILRSIAAFERTLTSPETSYDRFVSGDRTALTPQAERGLRVFTQIGCANCHSGPMFSDYRLHALRVPDPPGSTSHDAGDGTNRFRTPTLRNITRTAPYMHGGVFATIPQVFQFYRQATTNPIDPDLRGVRTPTPQEAPDVEAFLRALGDAPFDTSVPAAVPSGLTPGGAPR